MINNGGQNYLPGAEASGALGTDTSGLSATLYIHPARPPPKRLQLFYHIVLSQSSTPSLQSLQLQLSFPWLEKALKGFHNLGKESWSWMESRVGVEDGERIIW